MISIASGHSASYLTGQVGSGQEGYYTGAAGPGEPPGRWQGRGTEILGLRGEVDAEVIHALYGRCLDPRDKRFADPATREESARLGRAPKQFRSPQQVVEDRIRDHTREHASTPTPEQVQAWRIEAERRTHQAVMFQDVTYSPQKSVTVLHTAYSRAEVEARAAGDTEAADRWAYLVGQIDEAIAVANDEAIAYAAEHGGYSRTGRHGGGAPGTWVDAHDLVVASFYQHTSRDHDPQLHVHNAILNRVQCPDGRWRALDGNAVYATIQGAGAVASSRLMAELSGRLGVDWRLREDGNDFEIASIDQPVMDLFSTRRATLTERAEELIEAAEARYGRTLTSLERSQLHLQATLGTRAAKSHESWTREEQLDVWNARLQRVLAGSLTRVAEQHIALDAPAAREFSPEAVIAEAVAAAHGPEGEATLNRHELARRIHLALPAHVEGGPQARRDLLDALTDHAVERLVQVSGLEVGDVHQAGRLANGQAKTISPTSVRYAAPGQLAAEITLLNTAGRRGAACLNRRSAEAWITRHAPELSPAQREAVLGLAGSDAHLAVLVGAAGTGKTYTAGALDALWRDLTRQLPPPTPAPTNDIAAAEGAETTTAAPVTVPGRVVGLSVTQVAADVLHTDGVADTANLAAFLAAQNALDAGRTVAGSPAGRWRLGPRDIVLVDEASMIDTAQLVRLHDVAERAGARLVLMGDPAQLGSVGAGGMMRAIVERDAETYTLSEVRRFEADWERAASLALREGEQDAVAAYDVHGRIRDGGTQQATIATLAEAAAADRISGRSSVVVTATNEQGATVAAAIRRHLVTAGLVEEGGVVLGRDQNTAGVGDLVQARRIDRALGLTNRETYQVAAVRDDGGLDVVNTRTGQACLMPADYVATDVALAYAATAHAAQGATVDTGHVLLTTQLDRAGAYVGLTRGRESNTAWAVTDTGIPDVPTTTGRGLLAAAIAPEDDLAAVDDEAAAVDVRQVDQLRRSSAQTLLGLIEDETRLACRQRLEGHLDTLHADGVLSEPERARLGADQGCEHLSRLLRTYEQAGHEPLDLLRGAIEQRSLAGTVSIAQTLAYRLHRDDVLPAPTRDGAPQGIAAAQEGYLGQLTGLLADRRHDLAEQVAATQPAWVTTALGPMPPEAPETTPARADWLQRAGTLAAYREATGWDHDEIALGRCPGVHSPEKRAAWHAAYTAAGEPEQRRPEAELDTGRLLVRARAAELAAAHTPEAVFDAQREANLALADARRSAVLAHSRGDLEQAARHEADADHQARLAAALDAQTEARGMHLAYHAETFAAGQAAEEELRRRGVARGAEPDRTSATDWLAAEHRARVEDDAHRLITEADLTDHTDHTDHTDQTGLSESADLADAAARDDAAGPTADLDVDDVHEPAHLRTAEPAANDQVPDVDRAEVTEAASQAETTESDAAETVTAAAPVDEEVSTRSASAQLVEIEAAAAAAHAAMDEVADHTSQDAAHAETDDWDYSAGPDYAPAPDTGDELARDHTVTDETGSQAYEPVAEAGISE